MRAPRPERMKPPDSQKAMAMSQGICGWGGGRHRDASARQGGVDQQRQMWQQWGGWSRPAAGGRGQ